MSLANSAAEILRIRLMLGDAAEMKAITRVNEIRISENKTTVNARYGQLKSVSGVWLTTDPDHLATNYYGDTGTFNTFMAEITLESDLPADNSNVLINYTFYKGLSDPTIDMHVTNGKNYIEDATKETFDWTNANGEIRTNVAIAAMNYRASIGCLIYQFAPDILQKGYNFKLSDFSVESKTWAGSMGLRDLLDTYNKEVDLFLAQLGVYQNFDIPNTGDWRDKYRIPGRPYHGYKMDDRGGVY